MAQESLRGLAGKTLIVGIGAQRAGTTWLHGYLSQHPEVAMSPAKELHYWDHHHRPDLCGHSEQRLSERLRRLTNRFNHGASEFAPVIQALSNRLRASAEETSYMQLFAGRVPPDVKAFGEITPSYALLPAEGFRRLRAQHDQVKFIFILRDPVARFWSALAGKARRDPKFSPIHHVAEALSDPQHIERSRYDWTLQRLDEAVDTSDVLIEFYENLFTREAIARITGFIGIAPHDADFQLRPHATHKQPMPPHCAQQARDAFAPVYDYCRQRFGKALPWR